MKMWLHSATRPAPRHVARLFRAMVGLLLAPGWGWSHLARSFLMIFCLVGLALPATRGVVFNATLDRDSVTLGETVSLMLIFEGDSPASAPIVPPIPNIELSYVGQSSQISYVNGQTSSTLTHNYIIRPIKEGQYLIPAIRVQVGGKTYTSSPLKLTALKADGQGSETNAVSRLAFLKLGVAKNEVFIGEIFPVEIALYVQSAQDLQMPQLHADGFTLGQMQKPAQTRTQVGNTIYNLLSFRMTAAGAKAGTLTLGPAECSLVLHLPQPARRNRDPFGFDAFDFFNDRVQLRRVTLASEAVRLKVIPLPQEKVPDGFRGAIGTFALTVSAGPTNVAVGDPITLRVKINGRGTFESLTSPLSDWKGFKVYPPTSKVEPSDPLNLAGTKSFEQVVVPEDATIKELPPIKFSFFDPDQRNYRTLTYPGVQLVVRPSATPSPLPIIADNSARSENPSSAAQDIVYIKTKLGAVAEITPPLFQRPWFLALQGIPAVAWLAALVRRKCAERLANNPKLRRRRRVAQAVRSDLDELPHLAASGDVEAFYATVFRLLQEQLGERLDLPASAITEAVLDDHLHPRGVPAQTLEALRELFQACNQTRYGIVPASEELTGLISKVETVLGQLQHLEN